MIFRVNPYNRNARKPTITDLYYWCSSNTVSRPEIGSHEFSSHKTTSFTYPPHITSSHRKHNPLDDQATVVLPNDPWYTTTCQHISADCVTHGDKTWSIHLPWGHSPVISSVLLNVSRGTHDKQHVGILLCLLVSTWRHSKSSFSIQLHGPVWMWWFSNLSRHLPPLLAGIKLKWAKHRWLSTKVPNEL